jgi:hypothetical protein
METPLYNTIELLLFMMWLCLAYLFGYNTCTRALCRTFSERLGKATAGAMVGHFERSPWASLPMMGYVCGCHELSEPHEGDDWLDARFGVGIMGDPGLNYTEPPLSTCSFGDSFCARVPVQ